MIDTKLENGLSVSNSNNVMPDGSRNRFLKNLSDFRVLFTEQIVTLKASLVYYIFMQTVGPIGLLYALGHYAGNHLDNAELTKIIGGTVTFALVTVGLTSIAQKLSYMRYVGTLTYYSSLPISKISFILALLFSRLIILLPSILTPIIGGILMYNLNLHITWLLVVVLVLGAISLAVFGAMMGVLIRSYELVWPR